MHNQIKISASYKLKDPILLLSNKNVTKYEMESSTNF